MTGPVKSLLDKVLDFETRHARVISLVLGVWMMTSWVFYTDWITLPDIPYLTEERLFWASLGTNVVWWSLLQPMLENRKAERKAPQALAGPEEGDAP